VTTNTKRAPPHLYVPWTDADAGAIQALARGDASPEQQKRALQWIVEVGAMTYQDTQMDSDRDTAFANGRRFVGLRIISLTKISLNALRKAKQNA
jgi:hypothetical protein